MTLESSLGSLIDVFPVVVTAGVATKMADKVFAKPDDFSLTKSSKSSRAGAIGKTSIKHRGRTYRRWRAGYSPNDRREQKASGDPRAYWCESDTDFGEYHGLGCDLEVCPICKGQLLSCGHGELFATSQTRTKMLDYRKRNA